jgi:hypothetical protein
MRTPQNLAHLRMKFPRPRMVTLLAACALAPSAVLLSIGPAAQAAPRPAINNPASNQTVASFVSGYFHALDPMMMPAKTTLRVTPAIVAAVSRYYPAGPAATRTSQALFAYEMRTASNFRAWVRMHGFNYKSFRTRTTIVTLRFSASGQRATVQARTVTTFRWSSNTTPNWAKMTRAKVASIARAAKVGRYYGPGATVTSIVATIHQMRLIRQDGTWKVQSDWFLDPFNETVGPDHTTPPAPLPATGGTTSKYTPVRHGSMTAADVYETYQSSGAAAYADHYWKSYNTMFPNCNVSCGGGGDCTNFVSQALSYYGNSSTFGKGGDLGPEYYSSDSVDKSWIVWHNGQLQMSLPWDNANDNRLWVIGNPWGSKYDFGWQGASGSHSSVKSYDINYMLIGDLHYYHWSGDTAGANHAAIAVAYASDGETLVDAHNADVHDALWDLGASGATYYMVRMHRTVDAPAGS